MDLGGYRNNNITVPNFLAGPKVSEGEILTHLTNCKTARKILYKLAEEARTTSRTDLIWVHHPTFSFPLILNTTTTNKMFTAQLSVYLSGSPYGLKIEKTTCCYNH